MGTADCLESCHIDAYNRGILIVDTTSHQVKFKAPGGQVVLVVDTGKKRGIPMASLLIHHSLNQWEYVLRWTGTSL